MSTYIPASTRAIEVWRSIQGDPTSVVFTKPKVVTSTGTIPETQLAAQTVRISSDVQVTAVEGTAGVVPVRDVIIFGVRDHPTVADTDIQEGYTAVIDGDRYRISEVVLEPGEIRAHATVSG